MRIYKDRFGNEIKVIQILKHYTDKKNYYLFERKKDQQYFILPEQEFQKNFTKVTSNLNTIEKIAIYSNVFRGREDVYAKSYFNNEGRIQYYPSYCYGWKNLKPAERTCEPLTKSVIKEHLRGEKHIGIFPILKDDTCFFLAIDLDKKNWKQIVTQLRKVCRKYSLEANVELSRSGNGAHVWFFFEQAVSCKLARDFGKKLLELTMQETNTLSFDAFDRFFPNQDFLPKGGFGNLIALPLNGKYYFEGTTLFIDDNFTPFKDQWRFLSRVQKINTKKLEEIVGIPILLDIPTKNIHVTLTNTLEFSKSELSPQLLYRLKKIASFANPEFYLRQASRQSTYLTPQRIYLYEETATLLKLPRGLLTEVKKVIPKLIEKDTRDLNRQLKINFVGKLFFEQGIALQMLDNANEGILAARTGFGKTVLSSALIAKKRVKTIILVHNSQLLEQWKLQLQEHLNFLEEEAVRYTPTGKKKVIGYIGDYSSRKKWVTRLVDVVMIQSLFKRDDLSDFLNNYDMMIVDECHHVTARMFEYVVAQFKGKYLYGLTATPERKNGHEPILFQRIGPILYEAKIEDDSSFERYLNLRFTNFGKLDPTIIASHDFIELSNKIANDEFRNKLILKDILAMYKQQKKILVICNRHLQLVELQKALARENISNLFLITGKTKKKEREHNLKLIAELEATEPFILLSTGKFIGEGFDMPQLDTLFIAAPLAWKNNLIQYAGRIHREFQEKKVVQIFDYVDFHVPYLEKMFQKRQTAYRKMNYCTINSEQKQILYTAKDYEKEFLEDLKMTKETVIIVADSVIVSRLSSLKNKYLSKKFNIYCYDSEYNRKLSQKVSGKNIAFNFYDRKYGTSVVIMDNIMWYGSITLFVKNASEEQSLLRLESTSLVKEFLETWKKWIK